MSLALATKHLNLVEDNLKSKFGKEIQELVHFKKQGFHQFSGLEFWRHKEIK